MGEVHWSSVLDTINQYVFTGLADERLCDNAIRFVEALIFGQSKQLRNQIVEQKEFLLAMMLLFREDKDDEPQNNPSAYCQESVERLLLSRGLEYGGEVSNIFARFILEVEEFCKG